MFVEYAENHSIISYRMRNHVSHNVIECGDVIWLHLMQCQDDIMVNMAMLPEICMSIHKISKDAITSMQLQATDKPEPGSVDPVHDEMEL